MFSRRGTFEQKPNVLERRLAKARRGGEALLDLTLSNPTQAGLPYETEAISRAFAAGAAAPYEPCALGRLETRAAVGELIDLPPEQVALAASTSEAYGWLFKLLCDPGDRALVPRPSYPLFEMLARLEGVELTPYPLVYDGEWHADAAGLEAAVAAGPRPRAVLAVSPNNPTGQLLSASDFERLKSIGVPLLVDEVFATYLLEASAAAAPRRATTGLVFCLDGLSKRAALPGAKLAWIGVAGDPELVQDAMARLELIADTYLSSSGPVQRAAPALLAATASTAEALRARLRQNLDTLDRALAPPCPASRLRVEGGWYAVVRLPAVHDEDTWVGELLDRGVITHPGWLYDLPDHTYLVLSLLPEPAIFDEGVQRIATLLS